MAMATVTETTSEQLELLSPEEIESIDTEALEAGIESELEETLESESTEVLEDVVAFLEGNLELRTPSNQVNQYLIKVFTALVKNAVKEITRNPKTRAKLQEACRKGPSFVIQLLTPIIAKILPIHLRWMSNIFLPPIVNHLFSTIICKRLG